MQVATTSPEAEIRAALSDPAGDLGQVAEVFERLALGDRVLAMRALSGAKVQARIWELAGQAAPITIEDLIPSDYHRMRPVIFHGKNSLPAFSHFRKICCRPDGDAGSAALWGYNDTRVAPFVGPGYFVVHDTEDSAFGRCAFDYRSLPDGTCGGWPEIKSNAAGLSRFVYNNTVDYMRRVAEDVYIGSATRNEKELGNFFLLVRQLDD